MSVKKIGKFNFENSKSLLPGVKRRTGILLARNSEKFFKDNFNRGGFLDRSITRWRPSRKDRGKTLIETGSLRRSINTISSKFERIVIETGNDVPYGGIHNEGGQAGRNGATTIPQRKFIGNSATLDRQNSKIIFRQFRAIV